MLCWRFEFATDEIFHEMGLIEQLTGMLEMAADRSRRGGIVSAAI